MRSGSENENKENEGLVNVRPRNPVLSPKKLVGFKIGEFARPRFKAPAVRPLHTYLRSSETAC